MKKNPILGKDLQQIRYRHQLIIAIVIAPLMLLSCGLIKVAYYEDNYQGKIVDSETHHPIEGAVALAVWYKEYQTVGGPISEYYDAQETVTNQKGEFTIKGMGPRVMTHLKKMRVTIFKTGYEYIERQRWESLEARDDIYLEDNKVVIPLDKLSLDQRRKRSMPYTGGRVPMEKKELLEKEIDKELNEI